MILIAPHGRRYAIVMANPEGYVDLRAGRLPTVGVSGTFVREHRESCPAAKRTGPSLRPA